MQPDSTGRGGRRGGNRRPRRGRGRGGGDQSPAAAGGVVGEQNTLSIAPEYHPTWAAGPSQRGGRGGGGGGRGGRRSRHRNPDAPAAAATVHPPAARDLPPPEVGSLEALPNRARDLSEALIQRTYECLSCLEVIELGEAVWSCSGCYCVFHLSCIKRWASGSTESPAQGTFNCPQCRAAHPAANSTRYKCFCGKVDQPPYDPFLIPHSCGGTCGRLRGNGGTCRHRCVLQCHPGPCPSCTLLSEPKRCPCGATTYTYQCGRGDPGTTCGGVCGKPLSCGNHRCERPCHHGECGPCAVVLPMTCACGRESGRRLPCGTEFHCDNVCGRPLSCGNHSCTIVCHSGECPMCPRDVIVVDRCPCGARPLWSITGASERASCLDPIASCGGVCGKGLPCGVHTCQATCHDGPCEPCRRRVEVPCPCRLTRKTVPCEERGTVRCTRLCGMRLSCGRHYCRAACCPSRGNGNAEVHQCLEVCNKKLPCGHVCGELCHPGACPPCVHFVSETLSCACGETQLHPPQPCGTTAPSCPLPCHHDRPCGHGQRAEARHPCHYGPCPPCPVLVERTCVGGHATAVKVPCGEPPEAAVCDAVCGRELPCGHHCDATCHPGPCSELPHPCSQSCPRVLPSCGHDCGSKCHDGQPCPKCRVKVQLSCACGHITRWFTCDQTQAMAARQAAASTTADGEGGEETATVSREPPVLPCNDDCQYHARLSVLESRRRPTAAMVGAGGSAGGASSSSPYFYSPYLWQRAQQKGDHAAIVQAEKVLSDFADQSEEGVLALPPASRLKRALYHALAPHYGVRAESIDPEPKRSVMLTKSPSWYATGPCRPPLSLLEAVERGREYDPEAFFASVIAGTYGSPAASAEAAADADAKNRGLVNRCIRVMGETVTEPVVTAQLRDVIGQFVYGEEVSAGSMGVQAIVAFTSSKHRKAAHDLLRRNSAPFTYWIPSD